MALCIRSLVLLALASPPLNPAAKLEVAGTARVEGTLTLAPSGDQALDVSTGSIYKGGALFMHTKGGVWNTAVGYEALDSATTGRGNTAFGRRTLRSTSTGEYNTAIGRNALRDNVSGNRSTACGAHALAYNTTGQYNTAIGDVALFRNTTGFSNAATGNLTLLYNTTGYRNAAFGSKAQKYNVSGIGNTAVGYKALEKNQSGHRNIGIGYWGGRNTTGISNIVIGGLGVAGESYTTRIGSSQTRTFITGIRGVTTGNANAIPVLIDSNGQLGTISSSCRFKEDIRDMGDATERLMDLRAVLFRYKGREGPDEYGLIAEEVAEVFPDLVVYDSEGEPETVRYHLLGTMLLNEMQRQHEVMESDLSSLRGQVAALTERLAAVEQRE
jgi:hypothetical protein